jgi:NitT/TauT family transport system permease protein
MINREAEVRRTRPSAPDGAISSVIFKRLFVLGVFCCLWQAAAVWKNNALLLPSLSETAVALWEAIADDGLASAAMRSLEILLKGYLLGAVLAMILASLAVARPLLREGLVTLGAMLNPLPAIALLPLGMLWFGVGQASVLFVLIHSVTWPLSLAILSGFESTPETWRLVGLNYGLRGPAYLIAILVPAAFPSILMGLRVGWAFAWRTLIAAELIFGVSGRDGGLGWFIFRNRNEMFTDKVFAGLFTVILIGLFVDTVIFQALERVTVRRWGMQQ